MKTIRIYICLYFLLFSSSIHANNFLGGEVSYKLIDSTNRIYKISFYLYRDCSGPKLNAPINIIVYSTGLPLWVYTVYPMPQPPTGAIDVEVTPLCDINTITDCTDTNSLRKGYTRNLYEIVTPNLTNMEFLDLNLSYCCRNVNKGFGSISTLDSTSSNGFFIYSTIETKWIRGE